MSAQPISITFADPTHAGQVVASNACPPGYNNAHWSEAERLSQDLRFFADRAELETFFAQPGAVDQYYDVTLGNNELFKCRAAGFFDHQDDLHDLAFDERFMRDVKLHEAHGFDGIAQRFATPPILGFAHESDQTSLIAFCIPRYGTSLNGPCHILLRGYAHKLCWHASAVSEH